MSTREAEVSSGRQVSGEGPILLWRRRDGEGVRGLLLVVGVCPFPGCPERHVLVDGFRVSDASLAAAASKGAAGDAPLPPEVPGWAFTVSVELDGGEVGVEQVCDRGALEWFEGALDAELRSQLRERFERGRAEYDAQLLGVNPDGLKGSGDEQRGDWVSIPRDGLQAVIAGFQRGLRIARARDAARTPARGPRVGRNDPCPCGSGRKYKRCCLGSA